MNDEAMGIGIGIGILFGIPILILVLHDRISKAIWRRRNTPEELAADRRICEARIASPDWVFYERHLERPVPAALRCLYSDRQRVLKVGAVYDDVHYISTFEPLDEKALVDTYDVFGLNVVPFANSDGDIFYLRPGPDEKDAVYITYHDGGESWQIAPDVSVFLEHLS